MIELDEAKRIASEFLKCNEQRIITKVYDAGSEWIIFSGVPGKVRIGGQGALVNKEDGAVKLFRLPSDENFKKLKAAELIYEV